MSSTIQACWLLLLCVVKDMCVATASRHLISVSCPIPAFSCSVATSEYLFVFFGAAPV